MSTYYRRISVVIFFYYRAKYFLAGERGKWRARPHAITCCQMKSAAYSYNVFINEIKHPIALKYRRAERAPLYHIYNNRIYNMYCSFVFRPTHLNLVSLHHMVTIATKRAPDWARLKHVMDLWMTSNSLLYSNWNV